MNRMTKRNYHGIPFVPGYAPVCSDTATCELITKMCERLALLEDILDECQGELSAEAKAKLKEEGIL